MAMHAAVSFPALLQRNWTPLLKLGIGNVGTALTELEVAQTYANAFCRQEWLCGYTA